MKSHHCLKSPLNKRCIVTLVLKKKCFFKILKTISPERCKQQYQIIHWIYPDPAKAPSDMAVYLITKWSSVLNLIIPSFPLPNLGVFLLNTFISSRLPPSGFGPRFIIKLRCEFWKCRLCIQLTWKPRYIVVVDQFSVALLLNHCIIWCAVLWSGDLKWQKDCSFFIWKLSSISVLKWKSQSIMNNFW